MFFTRFFGFYCFFLFAFEVHAKDVQLTPNNYQKTWSTIQPGDKITFGSGEYRGDFYLNDNKAWSVDKPTIFMAESEGKVIIKGSDLVQGWQKVKDSEYIKEWPTEPEQVFINGKQLIQLGGTILGGFPNNSSSTYHKLHQENGGIWPGRVKYDQGQAMTKESFYYDNSQKKLMINTSENINESKVEVSVRRRPFFVERVSGIVLDGLVFEHSNTSYWDRGAAVTIIGNDNTIRNVKVNNTDLIGIQMMGDRNQLINSTVDFSGQLGVAMRGKQNLIKGVSANHNNTRKFNKWWEAGGFKFVGDGGLQNSEVIDNMAIDNQGDGIWFDWQNKNNLISNNVAAYNRGFGIHYELSQFATIKDNKVYGNSQRGIFLRDSANSEISNNMVIANDLEGIVAVYSGQKDNKGIEFGADNIKVNANIVGWNNGGALIIPKGASTNGVADGNFYLGDKKTNKLSLGYPSAFSPAVNSLKEWQVSYKIDLNSAESEVPMPTSILESLTKQTIINDWSAITKLVDNIKKDQHTLDHNSKVIEPPSIFRLGP